MVSIMGSLLACLCISPSTLLTDSTLPYLAGNSWGQGQDGERGRREEGKTYNNIQSRNLVSQLDVNVHMFLLCLGNTRPTVAAQEGVLVTNNFLYWFVLKFFGSSELIISEFYISWKFERGSWQVFPTVVSGTSSTQLYPSFGYTGLRMAAQNERKY